MNSSLSPAERLWAELVREQKYPPIVIEVAGAMGNMSAYTRPGSDLSASQSWRKPISAALASTSGAPNLKTVVVVDMPSDRRGHGTNE